MTELKQGHEARCVENWLVKRIAEYLTVAPETIDVEQPFDAMGIESVAAVVLSGELEEWLGVPIDATALWDYADIRSLAAHIAAAFTAQA